MKKHDREKGHNTLKMYGQSFKFGFSKLFLKSLGLQPRITYVDEVSTNQVSGLNYLLEENSEEKSEKFVVKQ